MRIELGEVEHNLRRESGASATPRMAEAESGRRKGMVG